MDEDSGIPTVNGKLYEFSHWKRDIRLPLAVLVLNNKLLNLTTIGSSYRSDQPL